MTAHFTTEHSPSGTVLAGPSCTTEGEHHEGIEQEQTKPEEGAQVPAGGWVVVGGGWWGGWVMRAGLCRSPWKDPDTFSPEPRASPEASSPLGDFRSHS